MSGCSVQSSNNAGPGGSSRGPSGINANPWSGAGKQSFRSMKKKCMEKCDLKCVKRSVKGGVKKDVKKGVKKGREKSREKIKKQIFY